MDAALDFQTILNALFYNFGMFAGLFTVLTLTADKLNRFSPLTLQIILGLFCGLAAALSMKHSIQILPGVILDSRIAVLTMGGLFYGPITALVSIFPAAIARIIIGGSGTELGVIVIVVIALVGVLYRLFTERVLNSEPNIKIVAYAAVINTLIVIGLGLLMIDPIYYAQLISAIVPAFILQNFIGTLILGALLVVNYRNSSLQFQLGKVSFMANKATRAKTEFLAMMSHEIRTPMNGVLGFAEVLGQTKLDEYQSHCVNQIKTAGTTMMHLLDDILDFSKIESGKFSLSDTPIDLVSTIESTFVLMETEANNQNNKMVLDIADDVPKNIYGDKHRIRQILYNLLGNAVKFTENGTIKVTVSRQNVADTDILGIKAKAQKNDDIRPVKHASATTRIESIEDADGVIFLSVSDTGIGIPEDKQRLIFTAFEQEDSSTSRRFGGTGLGLAIVKKLIEMMGGAIELKSQLGEGSRFDIYLPYVEVDEKVESISDDVEGKKFNTAPQNIAHSDDLDSSSPAIGGESGFILLAEDIEMNQELAASMLIQSGHQVHAVKNGLEAIEAVKTGGPFDLVLMDIRMPEMNGLDATIYIREKLKISAEELPIIALTAHVMSDEIKSCMDAGMNDFVSKPVNASDLIKKVSEWIKPSGTDSFDELLQNQGRPNTYLKNATIFDDNPYMSHEDSEINESDETPNELKEALGMITGSEAHEDHSVDGIVVIDRFSGKTSDSSPLIDEEMLNEFKEFMGPDKMVTVFDSFKEDLNERFEHIKTSDNDIETIKNETHAMASTSGNLGMIKLSLYCREVMSMSAKDIDLRKIKKMVSKLQDLADKSCDAFSKHLSN